MYYLQSRYYDPEIGRFINADAFASTGHGVLGHNMFTYCGNNPVNYADINGYEPITATITITAASVVAAGIVIAGIAIASYYAVKLIWKVGELIAGSIQTAWDQISYAKKAKEAETPDVTYPGDDPEKAPDGYEWKGKGKQGSKEGSYYKKETGESLHPDLNHPEGKDPHWDYNYKGSGVKGWRIFGDGRIELKQ